AAIFLRTPTKHSTNVDTAPSVVPVPAVVSRPSLNAPTPEVLLPTTMRNAPVRLLLNSSTALSNALISVQPQFTIFPSPPKFPPNEQCADRSSVSNSAGLSPRKHLEMDPKCVGLEAKTAHLSPITIITPTKTSATPQIMPLVQNSELRNLNQSPVQCNSALYSNTTLPAAKSAPTNTKTLFPIALPVDTVSHAAPNLLTTLRPLKNESAHLQSVATAHLSGTNQTSADPTLTSAAPILKPSSLVSHSTVPSVSIDNQTTPLVSVVSIDTSKSGHYASTAATTRSAQRIPIAVATNRQSSTSVPLSRSSIGRQPVIAPLSPLRPASGGPLTPSRKRARKQQLLAPHGTETSVSSTSGTAPAVNIVGMVTSSNDSGALKPSDPTNVATAIIPNVSVTSSISDIEASLQSSNLTTSPVPVVASANSSSSGTSHVLNLRLLQVRPVTTSGQSNKEVSSTFDHFSVTATTSLMASQLHSLVVSSAGVSTEHQPTLSATATALTTGSVAASLVTASSFHPANPTSQQSMYVFPTTAVATPFRAAMTATASTGNVLQVRFRTPTPTKSSFATATSQQSVRTVFSQPTANNTGNVGLQSLTAPLSPSLRKTPADWSVARSNVTGKSVSVSPTHIAPDESVSRVAPMSSGNLTVKTNLEGPSNQPVVPNLRLPDLNTRSCFEDVSTATASVSPCKRLRKQSNSTSGIRKQCTWELRTDPTDSNKCVWRSPLESSDPQEPSPQLIFDSDTRTSTLARDTIDSAESVIHGCPVRMHLIKPSHLSSRFSGIWKGPKTGHFLRSSEIRQRPEGPQALSAPLRVGPPAATRHLTESGLRRLRDQLQFLPPAENSDGQQTSKSLDVATLSELLDLRSQHAETCFVNHPVHTISTLDLTGWRLLLCLKNCEKLISTEYGKMSAISRASEMLQALRRDRCHNEQSRPNEESASMCHFVQDQQQALITRLFLQAIPPASPCSSSSDFGVHDNGSSKKVIDLPSQSQGMDADFNKVEELIQGLRQRIRTLVESLQRVSNLSHNLLASHQKSVLAFVDDLEFHQQQHGSNHYSLTPSSQSPVHLRDGSSSSTNEENEVVGITLGTKPPSSSCGALPPPGRGSASPPVQKGTSTGRTNFSNSRRR
uniref:SAP130_C domain-containing protein n=2 Tax=Mesocestoides corti TaxID=53468 RepID=A0A5K3FWA7_MESCO